MYKLLVCLFFIVIPTLSQAGTKISSYDRKSQIITEIDDNYYNNYDGTKHVRVIDLKNNITTDRLIKPDGTTYTFKPGEFKKENGR